MPRPKRVRDNDEKTEDRQEQVERNAVPFLNTDKNEGEVDLELGESHQQELGFDEPVQLGVNAIVVEEDNAPIRSGVWPERNYATNDKGDQAAEVEDNDDDHPRDDLLLVTNSDGTLLRAEKV